MSTWDSEEEMINELIETGCILDTFLDDAGEQVFTWDMDKLSLLYPDVYEEVLKTSLQYTEEVVSGLVDKGYLEMTFMEHEDGSLEPLYSLTELGKQAVEENNFGL